MIDQPVCASLVQSNTLKHSLLAGKPGEYVWGQEACFETPSLKAVHIQTIHEAAVARRQGQVLIEDSHVNWSCECLLQSRASFLS